MCNISAVLMIEMHGKKNGNLVTYFIRNLQGKNLNLLMITLKNFLATSIFQILIWSKNIGKAIAKVKGRTNEQKIKDAVKKKRKKETPWTLPSCFAAQNFLCVSYINIAWRKGREVMTGQRYDGRKMIKGGI